MRYFVMIPAFFAGSVFGALALSAVPSATAAASVAGGLIAAVAAGVWAWTRPPAPGPAKRPRG